MIVLTNQEVNTLLDPKDYQWVTIYHAELLASLSSQQGLPFMLVDCRLKKNLRVSDSTIATNIKSAWLRDFKAYQEQIVLTLLKLPSQYHLCFAHSVKRAP